MKRLVLLGCLITLIGCARQKTDAEYWMLKGRVAEMRGGGAIAYLKFGKWVPDTINRYDEIHTFDHSGRWMESRFFEKESYDEPNYVVQRSPGDSSVRIEYGYNREGDLKSISSIERINRTHTVKKRAEYLPIIKKILFHCAKRILHIPILRQQLPVHFSIEISQYLYLRCYSLKTDVLQGN